MGENESLKNLTQVQIGNRLGTIALVNSSIIELSPQDYDGKANIFGIISQLSKKMYVLKAKTYKEAMDWKRVIKPILQQKTDGQSDLEGYLSLSKKKSQGVKEKKINT